MHGYAILEMNQKIGSGTVFFPTSWTSLYGLNVFKWEALPNYCKLYDRCSTVYFTVFSLYVLRFGNIIRTVEQLRSVCVCYSCSIYLVFHSLSCSSSTLVVVGVEWWGRLHQGHIQTKPFTHTFTPQHQWESPFVCTKKAGNFCLICVSFDPIRFTQVVKTKLVKTSLQMLVVTQNNIL